jgi:hypothetical protein
MSKSTRTGRIAWNCGKIVGQKPPLTIKEVRATDLSRSLKNHYNLVLTSHFLGCFAANSKL